jgi:hypothetical protein
MGLLVKNITVVNLQGTARYAIGDKIEGVEIVKIKDESLEYETQYVSLYFIYGENDKLLKGLENCPVDVTYL